MPEFTTARDMFDLMAQQRAGSVSADIPDACKFRDQVMRMTIRALCSQPMRS